MNNKWMAFAVAALLAAGCVKEKILVVVNPDGSGNLVVSTSMSPETAGMMDQMTKTFSDALGGAGATNAGEAKAESDPLFNEAQFREEASRFGAGVEYVKATKTEKDGWKGATVVYAFKDVSALLVPLKKEQKMSMDGGSTEEAAAPTEKKPQELVRFAFTAGPTKQLKITMPAPEPGEKEPDQAAAEPATAEAGAEMGDAMMKSMMGMMKGAEVAIAVQVKGEVVKSSATHQEDGGQRTVLLAMNLDQLMLATNVSSLAAGGGDAATYRKLAGLPGLKMETKPEVVVEFK